jgi:large subunit ribosomal protein L7/L12
MKVFKKIAVSLVMALSMAAISSTAFAAEEKDKNAVVREAAEGTITKIEEAISLIDKNGDKAEIIKVIGDARQLQKEFRYELTERLRQKANDKLKAARESVENGDNQAAEETLKATLVTFKEMKTIYDAAHKS